MTKRDLVFIEKKKGYKNSAWVSQWKSIFLQSEAGIELSITKRFNKRRFSIHSHCYRSNQRYSVQNVSCVIEILIAIDEVYVCVTQFLCILYIIWAYLLDDTKWLYFKIFPSKLDEFFYLLEATKWRRRFYGLKLISSTGRYSLADIKNKEWTLGGKNTLDLMIYIQVNCSKKLEREKEGNMLIIIWCCQGSTNIFLSSFSFDPYCKGGLWYAWLFCCFVFSSSLKKFSLQVWNVSHDACAIQAIYMDNGKYIRAFELTGKGCKNKKETVQKNVWKIKWVVRLQTAFWVQVALEK